MSVSWEYGTVEEKRWLKALKVIVFGDQGGVGQKAVVFYHTPFGSIIFSP